MSMDFNLIEKAIDEAREDIEKCLKKDEYKMMAAYNAYQLINANKNKKGQIIIKSMDEGLQVEMNCNEALVTVIMMNVLEEYGIEKFIKLETARRIIKPEVQKYDKHFDTPEEMEVFKKNARYVS